MTSLASDLVALQHRLAGRYSVDRELGRGGMGVVYLARDIALDRTVALKVLPGELAANLSLRERFLREARLAARLSHPNIVPIFAVEAHSEVTFYAMGYVEGETLGARIERVGALPPPEVTLILQQVAWALAYAHGRSVIHRDIKPDNILIERGSGRATVMDFGIARAADPAPSQATDSRLTEVGHVVGTAAFMSPEQATGDAIDGRADLYSLGVVGFVALTGRLPFDAPTSQGLIAKALTELAPPVASIRPAVPPRLAEVVDKLLAKDPDGRFPSGEAVAEALGPSTAAQSDIAAPLRSFVRTAEQNAMMVAFLIPLVGIAILRPTVMIPLFFMGLAVVGSRVMELGLVARRIYRMGYRFSDLSHAFATDRRARADEARQLATTTDPALTKRATQRGAAMAIGGTLWFALLAALVSRPLGLQISRPLQLVIILVGVVGLVVAMFGVLSITLMRIANAKLKEATEVSGGFWTGGIARTLFEIAVRGVQPAAAREAAGALEDLLAETERSVPPGDRAAVKTVRRRIHALSEGLDRLRARDRELERAIAETGAKSATERLLAARRQVASELSENAAAIDALRLKLILVRSGVAGVAELGS